MKYKVLYFCSGVFYYKVVGIVVLFFIWFFGFFWVFGKEFLVITEFYGNMVKLI